jgi:hypothetical protein
VNEHTYSFESNSESFFLIKAVLGFELRTSLVKQALYHLSHISSLLSAGYFGDEILLLPRLTWTLSLLFYTSYHHRTDRHALPCPAFFH